MPNYLPDFPFTKPNQLISVIEKSSINRLARHLGNYFLQYAQQEVKAGNIREEFVLPAKELNEKAGIASKSYNEIVSSLASLDTTIIITDFKPTDLENGKPKKGVSTTIFHLIRKVQIDIDPESNTGVYKFWLEPELINLLQENDYYTQLNLVEFNNLESKHSIKLYEWLKRYETNPSGIPLMTIEKLRQLTQTSDKRTYDNFAHIALKILDVAVKEICEKTPYQVSYETIKERTGRRPKVTKLCWTFKRKAEPIESSAQYNVSNPLQEQSTDYRSRYSELAKNYVSHGFCETEAEFYKATWQTDFQTLIWFHDTNENNVKLGTKNKIKHLYKRMDEGKIYRRWTKQLEIYQWLLSRMREEDQKTMIAKQAEQGFYEQIVFMKDYLQDPTPVKDPEKWL